MLYASKLYSKKYSVCLKNYTYSTIKTPINYVQPPKLSTFVNYNSNKHFNILLDYKSTLLPILVKFVLYGIPFSVSVDINCLKKRWSKRIFHLCNFIRRSCLCILKEECVMKILKKPLSKMISKQRIASKD